MRSLSLSLLAFLSGLSLSSPRLASSCCHQQTLDVASLTSLIARQYLAPRLPPSLAVEHLCSRLPGLAQRTQTRTRIEAILKPQALLAPQDSSFRRRGGHGMKDEHRHHHHRLSVVGKRWLHCVGLPSLFEVTTCSVRNLKSVISLTVI